MATAMIDSNRSLETFNSPSKPVKMEVVNTETRLGEEVLSPVFLKELENYYSKANIQDKARCLELITSVNLGQELRRQAKHSDTRLDTRLDTQSVRPRSAMPAFGHKETSALNPYSTSYERDFPPKSDFGVWAIRPMTSGGYATTVPKSHPPGPTTYDVEFCKKSQRPSSPERSGTASGQRNNRPHPTQSFMVWRLPHNYHKNNVQNEAVSEELTNEKLNQITRRLCHSTYQTDYLGIPQGFQVKSAFNLPSNWRENVPYGMESNQRTSYQTPFQQQQLVVPVTRYGSNGQKHVPALAVVPTANKRLIGINGRTTYDRHYNDNAGPVIEQIRDVGKKLGVEALKKHYQQSTGQDKELIGKLLEEYNINQTPLVPVIDRPVCPTPPPKSRGSPFSHRSPTPSQASNPYNPYTAGQMTSRSVLPTPSDRPRGQSRLQSSLSTRRGSPTKLRPSVPAETPIMMPQQSPFQTQMPATPISVPYTPPAYLS